MVAKTNGRIAGLLRDLAEAESKGLEILGIDLVEPVVEEVLAP